VQGWKVQDMTVLTAVLDSAGHDNGEQNCFIFCDDVAGCEGLVKASLHQILHLTASFINRIMLE